MREPAGAGGPNPTRRHYVLTFAPVVLALLALGGLAWFHCGAA